jgi:hypothetical protein
MAYPKERRAQIVTSQQDRDDRARTFSQAPQAVRSARGRRGNRISPSTAYASRTLHADKCNALGLTTDVHSLGNVSGAAAARAVFRIHSSPSVARSFSPNRARSGTNFILLRNTNKFESAPCGEKQISRRELGVRRRGTPAGLLRWFYFVSSPIKTPKGSSETSLPCVTEAPVPIRLLAEAKPLCFNSRVIFWGAFDIFSATTTPLSL